MNNNDGQIPEFEKFPGSRVEKTGERVVPEEQDFAKAFETGVPEFAGNDFGGKVSEKNFGTASPENMYYGEAKGDDAENKRDEGIAEAGKILDLIGNIKVDEERLRKIYEFDADGAKYPGWELAQRLGVEAGDKPKGSAGEYELESGVNAPVNTSHSREGEVQAIKAIQELIGEVLEADKDYSELRMSGRGVVEQAKIENEKRGIEADRSANLAEILQGWAEYKKGQTESVPEAVMDEEGTEKEGQGETNETQLKEMKEIDSTKEHDATQKG